MAPHFVKHDSNGPGKVMVLSSIHIFLGHSAKIKWPKSGSWNEEDHCLKEAVHQCDPSLLPQADFHPPQLFSGLELWVPLCFKPVPGGLVFITAFGGRSCQFQLGTEKSLDRNWKRNAFIFFFFFLPSLPLQDRDQEKAKLLSFANPAVLLFVELTLTLFIEFPFFIRIWTFPCKISLGSGRKSL